MHILARYEVNPVVVPPSDLWNILFGKVQFAFVLKDNIWLFLHLVLAILTVHKIGTGFATQDHSCVLKTTWYPSEKIEWCVC